ncbi:DNA (cytosine-5-)-methyltransferase [Planctomycetota bacterium]|nr:DNA (cytosine-5-)-methyltransferase [Planctomycetota bacterium]
MEELAKGAGSTLAKMSSASDRGAEGLRVGKGLVDQVLSWPHEGPERQDFLHRARQLPSSVKAWRRGLLSEEEQEKTTLDRFITEAREVDRTLRLLHGSPDLGNKPDPVDELIYIALSRKTRESAYQGAYDALRARFASWSEALEAGEEAVAEAIAGCGLEGKKARAICGALAAIRERFGSCRMEGASDLEDDELIEFLCTLPDMEKKSALCVLMYSLGRDVFPVDAHVHRVLGRLGITLPLGVDLQAMDHRKAQRALEHLIPPLLRHSLHVNLVVHGRDVCSAANPRCDECELSRFCAHRKRELRAEAAESTAPRTVDLFCGAGGLSRGFERAGCRPVVGADLNEAALKTYAFNRPEMPEDHILCEDLSKIERGRLLGLCGGESPEILLGAPPCQGFSQAGHRSKGSKTGYQSTSDDRNYLYECVATAAAELKPRLLLLENVPGMQSAKEKGVSFLELAAQRIEEATGHEYETAIWRLNATEFGVPQDRTRFFIVGWRHGHVAPAMPAADYQDRSSREYDLDALPPITLNEAIHDLPPLAAGEGTAVAPLNLQPDDKIARRYLRKFKMRGGRLLYGHSVRYHNERDIELYGLLEPGENSVDAIEKHGRADLMRYRTDVFDDKYSRLRPDRPGKTIVAHLAKDGNGYIHPEQARSLTLREAARVQSFEDHYVFCGTPSEQWTQLGNSVPPVMAEAIARSFLRALEVENSR